jgi:hypothetical protein
MKKHSRKLSLVRETLIALQEDEMRRANGGGTVDIATSSAACIMTVSMGVTKTIDVSLKTWEIMRSKPK